MPNSNNALLKASDRIVDFFVLYGLRIIGALIIFVVGFLFARWLGRLVMAWLMKRDLEPPVRSLVVRVVRLIVVGMTMVVALEKLGVNPAALIAGIGVAGIGIGLALQGVLGNLVAGLLIILTKPFRVGEYVEILSVHGQVVTIELFSTTLIHPDRSHVIVPNRKIVGEILHNYGTIRQLDLSVGLSYGTDVKRAIDVVRAILEAHPHVLKDPAPVIGVAAMGESSITLAIKPWTKIDHYGATQADLNQAILERFRASKIEIPLPQREIRVLSQTAADTLGAA